MEKEKYANNVNNINMKQLERIYFLVILKAIIILLISFDGFAEKWINAVLSAASNWSLRYAVKNYRKNTLPDEISFYGSNCCATFTQVNGNCLK